MRNTTTVFDTEGLDRVRLTRFVGDDGIVRPYSQREALGQFWLKTVDTGKYFNESYIAHLELPGKENMVMLTYYGILMVRMKRLVTEWMVPLKDIAKISKERTGHEYYVEGRNGWTIHPCDRRELAQLAVQADCSCSECLQREMASTDMIMISQEHRTRRKT